MESTTEKTILNLSNITQLTTFTIAITVSFSLVRLYIYYVVLLHIPVFQYLEVSDIVLMVPTGIFYALYVGAVEAANFVVQSDKFEKLEKIFYPIFLYSFMIFVFWIGYRNDPIIKQVARIPIHYWYYGLGPFLIYMYTISRANQTGGSFFRKNRYVAVFILTIWYGVFESFANYSVLTESNISLHYIFKNKNGEVVKTSNNLIYAGRTRNIWFLYNRQTKFVRAFKNDNIEVVDFDTIQK